jgi:hypothetical protein
MIATAWEFRKDTNEPLANSQERNVEMARHDRAEPV